MYTSVGENLISVFAPDGNYFYRIGMDKICIEF